MCNCLKDVFSKESIEQESRESGFVKRKSPLTGQLFLDQIVFHPQRNEMSLNDHCIELESKRGIEIRKQSLNERFNDSAVCFIKSLLIKQLKGMSGFKLKDIPLNTFSAVLIKDSTRFQIHDSLADYYPGSSGAASGAGIHIQYEYDVLSKRLTDLTISDAKRADTTDAKQSLNRIEKNSLLLRDMGYFDLGVLEEIIEREAFFISRLKPNVTIYKLVEDQYEKVDLSELLKKMKRKKSDQLELSVYVGSKKKVPVRMIVERMPSNQVHKRMKKAYKYAKKRKYVLSTSYKAWTNFNIYITNVDAVTISAPNVRKLYTLRWQIELVFKVWKSICGINKTGHVSKERFECYLYGTLLYIMINWEIFSMIFSQFWNHKKQLLSTCKFFKLARLQTEKLRQIFFDDAQGIHEYLRRLVSLCDKKCRLEERKNQMGLHQIFTLKLI